MTLPEVRPGGTPQPGDVAPAVTVVIPAYNEAERLGRAAERLLAAAHEGAVNPETTEIILVDDGSTDKTVTIARRDLGELPLARILQLPQNAGKGAAVRAGVAEARGATTIFMDADMAVDPVQIPTLLAALEQFPVAIGSRSVQGSHVECDSLRRTVMGRSFNRLVKLATHVGLDDTQCGFKGFWTPVARLLFHCSVIDRFAFDVEVLAVAQRLGLDVAEIPVHWHHVHGSRIRPMRDPLSMVSDMVLSRVGATAPKPIEGALVAPGAALDGLRRPEEPTVTTPQGVVIPWEGGSSLALFPLLAPEAVAQRVAALRAALGNGAVVPRAVTLARLAESAPLSVQPLVLPRVGSDAPGARDASGALGASGAPGEPLSPARPAVSRCTGAGVASGSNGAASTRAPQEHRVAAGA